MEEESGLEPSRAELFIASRTRKDGSMVCEEARICVDKLKEVMNHKLPGETSLKNDVVAQVFGPEHSGRVRFLGRGVTPSEYFSTLFQAYIGSTCSQFKVNETDRDAMVNILKQAISKIENQEMES
ncbi:unnamed protein product [Microthlaspi erraticum]|uniref:Uncharacterized protein n=1 Tax=Microthlaspi erraticum TaxID=1685480 RepID=A0A6D2HKC1_9BRAS|nr:unnamed protein product [Microthlaspi erraticum]